MPDLGATPTATHLREAFARKSQTAMRYLSFAQQADIDGRPDLAATFRGVAETETGHAFGLLDLLADVGDPVTGEPIGDTDDNLRSAIVGERTDAERFTEFAEAASAGGFTEVAEWFDTVARADAGHVGRFESPAAPVGPE